MILVFLAALASSAHAGVKEDALRKAMDDIWEKGDLSVIDKAYAPDIAPKIKEFVVENRALYPDIQVTIDDVVIKGKYWITTWTVTGTHKDLHKPVKLQGVSVRTREGGVFTSESMFYDMKAVYDQLGFRVTPPEGISPFEAAAEHPVTPEEPPPEPPK
jgi:hypothetical protein